MRDRFSLGLDKILRVAKIRSLKLYGILLLSPFFLGGCAATIDAIDGLGINKPANAGPGYSSFRAGLDYERTGRPDLAQISFCASAELGNIEAFPYCEKYTLFHAAFYRFKKQNLKLAADEACKAKDYGQIAAAICQKGLAGRDFTPDLEKYLDSLRNKDQVAQPVEPVESKVFESQIEQSSPPKNDSKRRKSKDLVGSDLNVSGLNKSTVKSPPKNTPKPVKKTKDLVGGSL